MSGTCGMMIRKSVLERIGCFDEERPDLHEVELAYRICMHCKVGFLSKPLYRYYHYMDGKSIFCKADNYIEALRIVNEKYAVPLSQLTADQKRRYDAVGIKEIAYRYLKSGDKATYRRKIGPYLKQYGIKEAAVYYGSYFLDYNTFMKAKIVMKNLREKL